MKIMSTVERVRAPDKLGKSKRLHKETVNAATS